jgi:hypothetical protein
MVEKTTDMARIELFPEAMHQEPDILISFFKEKQIG